jgi:hypothetical protein
MTAIFIKDIKLPAATFKQETEMVISCVRVLQAVPRVFLPFVLDLIVLAMFHLLFALPYMLGACFCLGQLEAWHMPPTRVPGALAFYPPCQPLRAFEYT